MCLIKKTGFTLIEVLVVIGIITILAALLMPAISTVMKKGEIAQTKAEVKSIATAWKAYYNEYGRWPVTGADPNDYSCFSQPADESVPTGILMSEEVLSVLIPNILVFTEGGKFASSVKLYNPRGVLFLQYNEQSIDKSTRAMVDPWDRAYKFLFDVDDDGQINFGGFSNVYESVIVWSTGPDGKDGNAAEAKDNVNSWD